eukprot:SAG31_NODE_11162_length_1059_cov_1.529167_2_plen_117_part_01
MKDRASFIEDGVSNGMSNGNAWQWHQDYGYWYYKELYPSLASCMLALDRAHANNGALNVLRASHKLGRLDHRRKHDPALFSDGSGRSEMCADLQRVASAEPMCERVVCALDPGDALF